MIPAAVLRRIIVANKVLLAFSFWGKERANHSFHRLCCYITFFIFVLYNVSCNSEAKAPATKDTLQSVQLPPIIPLKPAEEKFITLESQHWYETSLKPKGFNGGIIVAKNGNIVFEKYTGMAHVGGTDSVTANTPFHIASVSKTFTAMAVLKLNQEKKLNIDDEFSKYFPQFNYPGVTIRSLLNHRSGLPNYTHFMETSDWDKTKYLTNQDILDYLVNRKADLTNIGAPDRSFAYCNTNYALLALLIEKVSGKKLPVYLKETFFDPLQMKDTYVFTPADSAKATPSYDWHGRLIPLNYMDHVYGDKNVYTTPRDLLTWDRALTSSNLFSKETLEQAYTPYSNEKPGIRNYGLGWRMNVYPTGKKTIYHNGWWHGSNASFIRLLQDSATIIVIGNKYTRAVYDAKDLTNIFGNYTAPPGEDDAENAKLPENGNAKQEEAPDSYRDSLLRSLNSQ